MIHLCPENVFDPLCRGSVSRAVKDIVEESLAPWQVSSGILRTGGSRSKRAKAFAMGVLFRENPEVFTGKRSLEVGKKEVIVEISPGIKPPDFLKARVITGSAVDVVVNRIVSSVFLQVKAEGYFSQNYAQALSVMIQRIVFLWMDNQKNA